MGVLFVTFVGVVAKKFLLTLMGTFCFGTPLFEVLNPPLVSDSSLTGQSEIQMFLELTRDMAKHYIHV